MRRRRSRRKINKRSLRERIHLHPEITAWPPDTGPLPRITASPVPVVTYALSEASLTITRGKIRRALHQSVYLTERCPVCYISYVMVITRRCCSFCCGGCINHTTDQSFPYWSELCWIWIDISSVYLKNRRQSIIWTENGVFVGFIQWRI